MDTQQLRAMGLEDDEDEPLSQQELRLAEFLATMPMIVGTDFDGTVFDADGLKAQLARLMFQVNVPVPSRLRRRFIEQDGLLTLDQYEMLKIVIYESEAGLHGHSYRGAVRCLSRLCRLGFGLRIVSNRTKLASELAIAWLEQRQIASEFLGIGIDTSKVDAVRGCVFYGDNDAHKLALLKGVVPHLLHIVPHRSWEEELDSGDAERVFDWDHAYQQIIDTVTRLHLAL